MNKEIYRRKLLKTITLGSGAIATGKSLPEVWTKPIVESVMLPAHADTTDENPTPTTTTTTTSMPCSQIPVSGLCSTNSVSSDGPDCVAFFFSGVPGDSPLLAGTVFSGQVSVNVKTNDNAMIKICLSDGLDLFALGSLPGGCTSNAKQGDSSFTINCQQTDVGETLFISLSIRVTTDLSCGSVMGNSQACGSYSDSGSRCGTVALSNVISRG